MDDDMKEHTGSIVHRVGSWVAIVGMGMYVMYIGQWVGAADEKFEDAKTVEQSQENIKERLTRLEEQVEGHAQRSEQRDEDILKAIEKLEETIKEEEDN